MRKRSQCPEDHTQTLFLLYRWKNMNTSKQIFWPNFLIFGHFKDCPKKLDNIFFRHFTLVYYKHQFTGTSEIQCALWSLDVHVTQDEACDTSSGRKAEKCIVNSETVHKWILEEALPSIFGRLVGDFIPYTILQ